jgi:hypothetical protein
VFVCGDTLTLSYPYHVYEQEADRRIPRNESQEQETQGWTVFQTHYQVPMPTTLRRSEDAMSPPASLARGVNPDTDLSETGPSNNINVTERADSPTASLSKGVKSDTVLAETVSPTDTNVTKRAISSTASLLPRVDLDTVQTETDPQNQVNSLELTTEGVVPLKTTPTKTT